MAVEPQAPKARTLRSPKPSTEALKPSVTRSERDRSEEQARASSSTPAGRNAVKRHSCLAVVRAAALVRCVSSLKAGLQQSVQLRPNVALGVRVRTTHL